MLHRLGWITAREARGHDVDEPLALTALRRSGVEVEVVDWDDGSVDWASYDRVVLRSTWDYPERLAEFSRWLDSVDAVTDLRNPPELVRWSLDKRYLADLAEAGIPVTLTVYAEPGAPVLFPSGEFVVKPAVGAGSRDAAFYGPGERELARGHVARLHARDAVVLVQPLLPSVAVDGEWPLVFFDGEYSHAASKRVALPRAGAVEGLFAAETTCAYVADEAEVSVAQAAVELVTARFGTPTYARVDLVRGLDGNPCVLEVELVEPSLFLPEAGPEALRRLVEAFARQ